MTTRSQSLSRLAVALTAAVIALPLRLRATSQCPDGMARIDDRFCIDRFEGSLVEVHADGTERAWSPYHCPAAANVRAVARRNAVPQAYISARQAERACRASGKRLCANREWTAACTGPQRTTYPYGAAHVAGRCNENHGRHPVVQLYGHTRRPIWDGVHMNDPQLNQMPGTLALTGAFESCTNGFGVFDMVGNVHEWIADAEGTFRGGYYMDTHLNGEGCAYTTRAHDTDYHDYSTGFRCCADLPGEE